MNYTCLDATSMYTSYYIVILNNTAYFIVLWDAWTLTIFILFYFIFSDFIWILFFFSFSFG